VPLLILALADTAAALVGPQYGHWRYTTAEGGRKSLEGSFAFFIVAFFAVQIPVLLFTNIGRAEALLIALILGLLVTLCEAVAWRGLDNLFIPLAAFFLLQDMLSASVDELLLQFAVIVALAIIALGRRARTTLDDSALLSAVLAGYVIWVLGGWQWIVIPLILFLRGQPLPSAAERADPHYHHVHAVLSVAGPGLLWLFLAKMFQRPDLFYPFALTFAVHLAIFEIAKVGRPGIRRSPVRVGALAGAKSWLMLFVPFVLIEGLVPTTWVLAFLALPIVIAAAIGFCWTQRQLEQPANDTARWVRQAAWSTAGATLGLVCLFFL
jgi:phytol kinase